MQGLGFEPRHSLRDTPLKRTRLTTSLLLRNRVRLALVAHILVYDFSACQELKVLEHYQKFPISEASLRQTDWPRRDLNPRHQD